MARKDGGESEGIVLYPSRSPSFGWKPTPLAPLVRGVKAMRPDEGVKAMRPTRGWKKSPPDKGGWGVTPLIKAFSTALHRSRLTPISRQQKRDRPPSRGSLNRTGEGGSPFFDLPPAPRKGYKKSGGYPLFPIPARGLKL